MSLIKPRWVRLALVATGSCGLLWAALRPGAVLPDPFPPIAVVNTKLAEADVVDLAMGDGLFANMSAAQDPDLLTNGSDASPPPAAMPPRLVGIATGGRSGAMILAVSTSGETRILKSGDKLDGWAVGRITRNGAVFTQGERQEIVGLDRSNKGAVGATGNGQQAMAGQMPQAEGRLP